MVLNIFQDVATPHNNLLIRELKNALNQLNLFYSQEKHPKYNWSINLSHEIQKSYIHGSKFVSIQPIYNFVKKPKEKYLIVGWSNPTTRFLILLFFILRKKFNLWFDYPNDNTNRKLIKKIFRQLFYIIIKHSKCNIFCCGKNTIGYFEIRGFSRERLINLPVLPAIVPVTKEAQERGKTILKNINLESDNILLLTGSRLIYEKGFDILIEALSLIPNKIICRIKLLIIGHGPESENLNNQICKLGLSKYIFIVDWLDVDVFQFLIKRAYVFIHPARFDAYGGGTLLSLALGIPVIGSYEAGSTVENIIHGENGFLYHSNDVQGLSNLILEIVCQPELRDKLSKKASQSNIMFSPINTSRILIENLL